MQLLHRRTCLLIHTVTSAPCRDHTQGEVREQGSHSELLNKPGDDEYSYKTLCEAQALSMDTGTAVKPDEDTKEELTDVEVIALEKKRSFQGTATLEKENSIKDGEEGEEGEGEKDEKEPDCCDIWKYNKPELPLFFFAVFCSLLSGAGWPVFAFIITVLLDIFYSCSDLSLPLLLNEQNPCVPTSANETFGTGDTAHYYGKCQTYNDIFYEHQTCEVSLKQLHTDKDVCYDGIRSATNMWVVGLLIVAIVTSAAEAIAIVIYAFMGQNLTKRLRHASLKSILRQNIGWFDEKDNATGALTLQLSTDAAQVESAMGARIGKLVDQNCSLLVAVVICFIYSWELTLVMLASSMVMMIGLSLGMMVRECLSAWWYSIISIVWFDV